jgi:CcmD family protein
MQKLIVLLCLLVPAAALADEAPGMPPNAEQARKACADAMNAYPEFATKIVETINEKTAQKHRDAADKIARNERHVILAYGAIWVVSAAFVLFLWARQRVLKEEISRLRNDLAAAMKDPK